MQSDNELLDSIVEDIGRHFRCFGGGKDADSGNPIAAAMSSRPLSFAMDVDVREVVAFVLRRAVAFAETARN